MRIIFTIPLQPEPELIQVIPPPSPKEIVEEEATDVIPGSVAEEIEMAFPTDTVEEQEWKEEQKRRPLARQ